ncbi:unnamed protein product [Adineta ricciae]|uniref:Uncharacterized protein n=1 Tax=Adineta ricciae TaxID=249248 RepID=A0A814I158_ADIRI|nr:unnamed protein product [Adineta ricciae]
MGACAGKSKSNANKTMKDKNQATNSSSLTSKDLPVTKDEITNEYSTSINKVSDEPVDTGRMFPIRIVSVSDSELEIELAYLVYGHPENEYAEKPWHGSTIISAEV